MQREQPLAVRRPSRQATLIISELELQNEHAATV